jgi:hypothetical protein
MPKQTYSDVESAGQSFASESLPYNPYSFEASSYATKRRGSGARGAWPGSSAGHAFSSESTRANRAHRGSRVHGRYGTDASRQHSNANYNESARQSAYPTLLDRQASVSHDPSLDFNVGQGNLSRVPSDGSIETRETAKFQVFVEPTPQIRNLVLHPGSQTRAKEKMPRRLNPRPKTPKLQTLN